MTNAQEALASRQPVGDTDLISRQATAKAVERTLIADGTDARELLKYLGTAIRDDRVTIPVACQPVGVPKGFVLVPRVLPQEVADAMTEVTIVTGVGEATTALNWEEAQEVWDAALAMFDPLPAAPATDEGVK